MKQLSLVPPSRWWAWAFLLLAITPPLLAAGPEPLLIQSTLVWGTNDRQSSDPTHRPVSPEMLPLLRSSPLRWTNYFEIKHAVTSLTNGETRVVVMSEHCKVEFKNLGGDLVEAKLLGDNKPIGTRKEKLKTDWTVVLAGPAEHDTAWLVVYKKASPTNKLDTVRAP